MILRAGRKPDIRLWEDESDCRTSLKSQSATLRGGSFQEYPQTIRHGYMHRYALHRTTEEVLYEL